MRKSVCLGIFLSIAVLFSGSVSAQDKTVKKIIEIGQTDNRVMVHENHLANYIGGRPVGSSALTHAEAWVKEQFESWGLEVMVQEAGEINVGFDRGPWFGRMLSEDGMALHFGTPSYTAPTKGKQTGNVLMEPHSRREFEKMKGALKGAWVLLDAESNGMAIDWSDKANEARAEVIKGAATRADSRAVTAVRLPREATTVPRAAVMPRREDTDPPLRRADTMPGSREAIPPSRRPSKLTTSLLLPSRTSRSTSEPTTPTTTFRSRPRILLRPSRERNL